MRRSARRRAQFTRAVVLGIGILVVLALVVSLAPDTPSAPAPLPAVPASP